MDELTDWQKESLFYEHLNNAINSDKDLTEGFVINKEASKNIGNGLRITVHPNDHGTHFHLIHGGRGIDAKFDYPDMSFIKYARDVKDPFTSRQLKNISVTLRIYSNFIEKELRNTGRLNTDV